MRKVRAPKEFCDPPSIAPPGSFLLIVASGQCDISASERDARRKKKNKLD